MDYLSPLLKFEYLIRNMHIIIDLNKFTINYWHNQSFKCFMFFSKENSRSGASSTLSWKITMYKYIIKQNTFISNHFYITHNIVLCHSNLLPSLLWQRRGNRLNYYDICEIKISYTLYTMLSYYVRRLST